MTTTLSYDATPRARGALRLRQFARRRGSLAVLLCALSLPYAAGAVAQRTSSEPKTLRRLHDPVVIHTSLLGRLSDHRTSSYRLYAAQSGDIEPIPFQFDERGRDGQLVLANDGADDEFTFDDDDELAFMAKDSGDRVDADRLPGDAALEIEVADAGRGERGWAYLVHFSGPAPPRSPIRYAVFDAARNEVRARFYEVCYSRDQGNFVTGLSVAAAAGGTGRRLVDRMRIRISPTFSLLFTTWTLSLTEKSFLVTNEAVKNGPVRAVRRVRESLDLGRFLPDVPNGTVTTYYYFSSFVTPATFSIPALALQALRHFDLETIDEFGAEAADVRYSDEASQGLRLGGSDPPKSSDRDHDWWVASGSAGNFLHAMIIPKQWQSWGITRGAAFAGGGGPGAGYSLVGMTNLRRAGTYEIKSAVIVLPRAYQSGDETEALAMLRQPLQVHVRALSRSFLETRLLGPAERSRSDVAGN